MSTFDGYVLCIALGLLLIGIEVFVPGGIAGAIGACLLLAAVVMGFHESVFGAQGGAFSALAILVGLCVYIVLILTLFPNSFIGRRLTLTSSMRESKSSDDSEDDLLGEIGIAHSDLRPSGIAVFGKRRIDVVADGAFVARGAHVKVVRVQGARVTVKPTGESA